MRVSRGIACLLGLLLLIAGLPGRGAEATYALVDLGTLGGDASEATALNEAGHVAGWSAVAGGALRAFLYRDGGMIDLGTLPGGTESRATGLDDAGRVVGFGGINEHGPQFREIVQGFLWQGGRMQPLGALHCPCTFNTRYGTSAAHGISPLGLVVGASETVRGPDVLHATAWDPAGGARDIGGGAGDWSISRAFAVNALGHVAGDFALRAGPSAPPPARAALWVDGERRDLGTLPGHAASQALGLDSVGRVVGWSGGLGGQAAHAVLWDRGALLDLGVLPGDGSARARGVNATGQVVGESVTADGATSRAFLWHGGAMQDLNALLPAGSGWTLTSAAAINSAGHIAGVGLHHGQRRAFLLVDQAPTPTPLAASVLPASRSVPVNAAATAFATIVNPGPVTATACGIAPGIGLDAGFTFQTTDPVTNQVIGGANSRVDIPPGGRQSYVFALTPGTPSGQVTVPLRFECANLPPAPVIAGVNTFLLVPAATPAPDVVSLAATLQNDGVVHVPGAGGTGVFAVAMANVGVAGAITVSADTGGVALPLSLLVCETDPASGACRGAPAAAVTRVIEAGEMPSFGIFVTAHAPIPFAPALHRVFVRARDAGGVTRGSTSVAAHAP